MAGHSKSFRSLANKFALAISSLAFAAHASADDKPAEATTTLAFPVPKDSALTQPAAAAERFTK